MDPVAIPEFADAETERRIETALYRVAPDTVTVEELEPATRRRLRDLLRPQANGEQDSW